MDTELPEYEIRLMRREEVPDVLDLWRQTGFSEGTHSLDTWFEYDPEGFYVAVANDGEVLGVCAGVLQHNDLASIGMYAVKSTFQRRGIGRKIWDKTMERVGGRNAGVNPVPAMLENYRDRAGFPIQSDWLSVVCVAQEVLTSEMLSELPGIDVSVVRPADDTETINAVAEYDVSVVSPDDTETINSVAEYDARDVSVVRPDDTETINAVAEYDARDVSVVRPDDTETINAVAEYDAGVLGFSRGRLVPIICSEKDTLTIVATKSHDNSVCGYGTIKENMIGNALVGPLFADDNSVAEVILYHLVKNFPLAESKGVTLMTVDCNHDALDMVERLGFLKHEGTARLYRSEEVAVQFNKVFAQHNLNFSVF